MMSMNDPAKSAGRSAQRLTLAGFLLVLAIRILVSGTQADRIAGAALVFAGAVCLVVLALRGRRS
jgi:hypothetical protein